MPLVLLKPHVLGIKNRFIQETDRKLFGRDALVVVISLFIVAVIYAGTYSFLAKVRLHPMYDPEGIRVRS